MVYVYAPEISSRTSYIFDLLLNEVLGIDFMATSVKEEYIQFHGVKINYSQHETGDELFLPPVGLLEETMISACDPEIQIINGIPVLFPVDDLRASLPFDIFAASFFLVTRYEEYFPLERDAAGRYRPEESLAFRENFLHLPLVNIWAEQLYSVLQKKFPGFHAAKRPFTFTPTIDIDHAYAYRQRGFFRSAGGFVRAIYKRRWKDLLLRLKVLANLIPDPFDVYDRILEYHTKYHLQTLYFILFADYGGDDNGVNTKGRLFQQLLLKIDEAGVIGAHPSRASNQNFAFLESELFGLSNFIGRDISISRQHFLILSFPDTYKRLQQVGITDDYSMGYASVPGFRASIATPFMFFDLVAGTRTELKIHPFAFMDVTFRDYLKLDIPSAFEKMKALVDAVKSVNGELVSLWHNESLSEVEGWKGWRALYESFLEYVMK